MGGSGKGGNNRKGHQRSSRRQDDSRFNAGGKNADSERSKEGRNFKKSGESPVTEGKHEKNRISLHDRPHWTAPSFPASLIPAHDCSWCGKPVKDIASALPDKASGLPVHFDCVLARFNENENLDENESICYIGGGRFAVIQHNKSTASAGESRKDENPAQGNGSFKIKKTFEWENNDGCYDWRRTITEHFSVT